MKIVQETALFGSGGADQGSEFGLEQQLLAGLGVHGDHQGDGVFGKLDGFDGAR